MTVAKFAIISDLHSNLEAVEAVFGRITELGVDDVVCLGDVVGYGADPLQVAALVMQRCKWTILGNHDWGLFHALDDFNPLEARLAAQRAAQLVVSCVVVLDVLLAVLLAVLVFKLFILLGVAIVLGMPLRTAWIAGFSLCQVGEFAFVLNTTGSRFQLLSPDNEQLFLTVIVLTMMLTSFLIAGAPQLTQSLLHLPWPRRLRAGLYKGLRLQIRSSRYDLQDHLVIVGYGINGRNVARAAKRAQVPYVVLETNPDTVRSEQALGEPLFYGDATQKAVLNRVGIRQARTVVVVIAEATATRRIVSAVRELNPSVYLIARTRYVREVEELRRLGANEVVPEEFETALEIFDRVLTQYLVPRPEIDHLVEEMRSGNYDLLRQEALPETTEVSQEPNLHPEIQVTTLLLDAACSWTGQSLQKIHLRAEHGVSLVALRRQGKMLLDLSGETILQADDELFLIGPPEKMRQVAQLLRIEVV